MKRVLLIVVFALMSGCETYRHQYTLATNVTPQTKRKYALRDCNVYHFSKILSECHRSTMNASAFDEKDLREMENSYSDVFAEDGIPVSIKLCYDMDRYDTGNLLLGVLDPFLFLGTVGVVPLIDFTDQFVEVEIKLENGKATSPRVGVNRSSRTVIWSLGLNLLFPFDEPTDSRYSESGRACLGMANEKHSHATNKRCRNAAFAYAIAVALTEYERKCVESAVGHLNKGYDKTDGEVEAPSRVPEESADKKSGAESAPVIEIEQIPL